MWSDPATLVTDDGRILEEQTAEELTALLRDSTDESGTFYVSTNRLLSIFLDDIAQTEVSGAGLRELTVSRRTG